MTPPPPVPSPAPDRPRPVFSRLYARISEGMDAEGLGGLRSELLAPLSGRVVEVDRASALAELRRVLRAGGTLVFLEHGLAPTRPLRAVQRVVDATVWPLLAGGCHTAVDPVGSVEQAGFEVTALRRLRFPDTRVSLPVTPHVLGSARRAG